MKAQIEDRTAKTVDLIAGAGGVFEITADGRLLFSKKQQGRFPEDSEIERLFPRS